MPEVKTQSKLTQQVQADGRDCESIFRVEKSRNNRIQIFDLGSILEHLHGHRPKVHLPPEVLHVRDQEDQHNRAEDHHVPAAPARIGGCAFHGVAHRTRLPVLNGQDNAVYQVKQDSEIGQVRQHLYRRKGGHKLGVLIELTAAIRSCCEELKVACEVSCQEETEEESRGRHGILLGEGGLKDSVLGHAWSHSQQYKLTVGFCEFTAREAGAQRVSPPHMDRNG